MLREQNRTTSRESNCTVVCIASRDLSFVKCANESAEKTEFLWILPKSTREKNSVFGLETPFFSKILLLVTCFFICLMFDCTPNIVKMFSMLLSLAPSNLSGLRQKIRAAANIVARFLHEQRERKKRLYSCSFCSCQFPTTIQLSTKRCRC